MRSRACRRFHPKTLILWTAPIAWLGCSGGGGTDISVPSLTITTATTGVELDPDGYSVAVDGSPPQQIGLDATLTIDQLSEGSHTVTLADIAENCAAGENPQTVAISSGSTAAATFAVTCAPSTGSLVASTSTDGTATDPDGFELTVDGAGRGSLPPNGSVTVPQLSAGTHLVGLTGLALNCTVTGDNPIAVTVVAGETAQVRFTVTCNPPAAGTGTLQVTTSTSGFNPDPDGYGVSLDGGTGQPIGSSGTLTLPNLPAGQHAVELQGVAANCTVSGTNPQLVSVTAGGTATLAFTITCVAPPAQSGSVRIATTTTGDSPDDSYTVSLDGANPQAVVSNGNITIANVPTGAHSVALGGVAANCTVAGNNPKPVTVTASQTASVSFAVACVTPPPTNGSIIVSATTSGSSLDSDGYRFSIDNGTTRALTINGNQTVLNVTPGSHSVRLGDIASNCTVAGDNPRSVTVTAGQPATVAFTISCVAPAPTVNFSISNLYITQSTQTLTDAVPLVANRAGYLRVFVVANQSTSEKPVVRITLRSGAGTTTRNISAPSGGIPLAVDEGTLNSSWNLPIEASLIQPGLSVSAEVDPGNLIPESNEVDNGFPASGTPQTLNVQSVAEAKIRFVPIQQGEAEPGNATNGNKNQLVELTRKLYPLNSINTDIHAVYSVPSGTLGSNGEGWGQLLGDLDALRVAEGSDRTYFGMAHLDYQFGVLGIGFVGTPTALGSDQPFQVERVVAHELGHTWGRFHAPCGIPPDSVSQSTIDPSYPYGAGIGVYGFDVAAVSLKPPFTPDIMGYCINPWISDYNYTRVMSFRAVNQNLAQLSQKQAALLVWGRIVQGQPILEPAFHLVTRPLLPPRSGPYSVQASATDGSPLFSLSFEPTQVVDDPNGGAYFAFAVPLSASQAARLGSLQASGPRGAAAGSQLLRAYPGGATQDTIVVRRRSAGLNLEWNPSAHPVIMVRDPDTGEILSFARGGRVEVRTGKSALDLLASDGIHSEQLRVHPR